MALRNAFDAITTETTANNILNALTNPTSYTTTTYVDQTTLQRELLQEILKELKILNLHMSLLNDQELRADDLDQEN